MSELRSTLAPAASLALTALRWTALGAGLVAVSSLAVSLLAGNRMMTVMSGSMEPEIMTGDVVSTKPVPARQVRVGDVVTFKPPDDREITITHRVRGIRAREDKISFVTKGDANDASENWQIRARGTVGRVTHDVPKLGYALAWMRDPQTRLFMLVLPTLLLGALEVRRIWQSEPQTDESVWRRVPEAEDVWRVVPEPGQSLGKAHGEPA